MQYSYNTLNNNKQQDLIKEKYRYICMSESDLHVLSLNEHLQNLLYLTCISQPCGPGALAGEALCLAESH